ncbi:TPR repeat-containing protein [Plectosphaerella plurivora]|uniref:TPR repeat-containing protein n=1 Tax=Plectosphaerella plurivora TaxID=936078 RepID=A0A9P8VDI7_9PEZI|nr:TPR repeat-containing protein [Plectosphaerella plurivora]
MAKNAPYPYDLGQYSRPVTTTSPEAQTWFDRGLVWCFAFNHEEAARCFARALVYDSSCAMAYWGIAYAVGPNYNKAWSRFDAADLEVSAATARDALARADQLSDGASSIEKALIQALGARFPSAKVAANPSREGSGPTAWNQAYADAMAEVYTRFGADDLDVAAFYAEALICMRPRQLWDLDTGEPTTRDTTDARAAIEEALGREGGHGHPGLNHLYIHLMEMSSTSHLALPAADRLRTLAPDGSHLEHMATHIDVAVGDYRHAIESNRRVAASDDAYFARDSASVLYKAYRTHNLSALAYAAMMAGRSADAISAARHLRSILTPELLSIQSPPMVDWVEFQGGILVHALIRFGRWDDILALELPEDQALWGITTATTHYGRAIALGVLNRRQEARAAQKTFEEARKAIPKERRWGVTSTASQVLAVASRLCEGELTYREGHHGPAFKLLVEAVELEDALPYSDPPNWMQPVRHALGALLLEQGHATEAEDVYRDDLGIGQRLARRKARINNVWGLHGLHESLIKNGNTEDAWAVSLQRDIAVASADVPIAASCFCRVSVVGVEGSACC